MTFSCSPMKLRNQPYTITILLLNIFNIFLCYIYMVALIKYTNKSLLLWEHFNIQDAYHSSVDTPPYLNCWQYWLFALRLTICLIQFFKKLMENIFNQMFANRYILHFRVHLWSWEINHILSPFFTQYF
jgi:hypothetical protein